MVLPPLLSILAAAVVAVLSAGVVVLHKKGVELPLLPATASSQRTSQQRNAVFFSLTPSQRTSLLQGRGLENATTTAEIRNVFQNQGYVIVRGLLDDSMLQRLDEAGTVFLQQQAAMAPQTFAALKFGPVYLSPPNNSTNDDSSQPAELAAFRHVSLTSSIPTFIASVLLDLSSQHQTLRVLKDVFLAKGNETGYCGFHVDDQTFWPISYNSTKKQNGVNTWIAMDDMPASWGGGLAVVPQSHEADWRYEAYQTIGSTPTYPNEGYSTPKEMFENYTTSTCNLHTAAPKLAAKLDRAAHVFDFQRGDVLLHTRWLFHKSIPLTKKGVQHYQNPVALRRYSIRYEVGDARLLQGFSMEPSIVLNQDNSGKSLDQVSVDDGASWYPQCWPHVDEKEMERLHDITETKLPEYEPLQQELFKELIPYFRKE